MGKLIIKLLLFVHRTFGITIAIVIPKFKSHGLIICP